MLNCRLIVMVIFCWLACHAVRAAQGDEESATRQELVQALLGTGDDQQKMLNDLALNPSKIVHDTLFSWTRDEIYLYQTPNDGPKVPVLLEEQQNADGKVRAFRIDTAKVLTDGTGKELLFDPSELSTVDTDMRLRSAIQQALDTLALADPNVSVRSEAVQKLGKSQKTQFVPILEARLPKENDSRVKKALEVALATLKLHDSNPGTQMEAIGQLSKLNAFGSLDDLQKLAGAPGTKPETAQAARKAVKSIQGYLATVNFFGTIFRGMSTGSILLVVALGLAITFGLMGIINMAHGEMIAIGAYTCYVVENVFGTGLPINVNLPITIMSHRLGFGFTIPGIHATGWFYECYFLVGIPLAFIVSALAGLLLERTVIQFLYRRPLESLLATWGVSLCMQQSFRMVFGANNVQINSPDWLKGHFELFDIDFDYNRLFVIAFAIIIVIGTWMLLTKTPLGLLIRAVMQNRDMAACMGVPTQRVNMLTFAFGSGLAGLAGAFLSQIGNVGPSMGQTWIVDSFMTVVVGGVGNIVGTIYAALGIGTADQVLQQIFSSPVVGKITVLVTIILFLQWKPGGLFPTRSRSLEG
jgi:urea transport system permease protein